MTLDSTSIPRSCGFRLVNVTAIAFTFCVLYVLSAGPVWWLHKHGVLSKSAFQVIYRPVGNFMEHSPGDMYYRYIAWWSPVIEL